MTTSKDIDPLLVGKDAEIDLLAKEEMLLKASENENTKRALDNAVKHFRHVYGASLPCTDVILRKYLIRYAGELSVSTLEQRRVLIGRWHREHGFDHNPNDSEEVRRIMRGIRRKYGRAPKQAKPAPLRIIEKVIVNLDQVTNNRDDENHSNRLRSVRDKALLLTAFWFGLRSDELINLRVCDINFHWDADTPYFELYLSKSKTDRDAHGRTRKLEALPNLCPMHALRDWLEISCNGVEVKNYRESELPLFSKVSRWGKISKTSIHKNSIYKVFIRLIQDAGIDTSEYSTHSMRRGIANWIIDSGASVAELKEWIGWSDTRTAMRYLDGKSSLPSKIIERKFKERLSNNANKDKIEYDHEE